MALGDFAPAFSCDSRDRARCYFSRFSVCGSLSFAGCQAAAISLFFLFEGPLFELWEQQGLFPENRPLLKLDPIELWLTRFKEIYAPGTTPLQQVTRLQDFIASADHCPFRFDKQQIVVINK